MNSTIISEHVVSHEYTTKLTQGGANYLKSTLGTHLGHFIMQICSDDDPDQFVIMHPVGHIVSLFLGHYLSGGSEQTKQALLEEGMKCCGELLTLLCEEFEEDSKRNQFEKLFDWDDPESYYDDKKNSNTIGGDGLRTHANSHSNNETNLTNMESQCDIKDQEELFEYQSSRRNPPSLCLQTSHDLNINVQDRSSVAHVWNDMCTHVFGKDVPPKFNHRNLDRAEASRDGNVLISFYQRPKRRHLIEFVQLCHERFSICVLDDFGSSFSSPNRVGSRSSSSPCSYPSPPIFDTPQFRRSHYPRRRSTSSGKKNNLNWRRYHVYPSEARNNTFGQSLNHEWPLSDMYLSRLSSLERQFHDLLSFLSRNYGLT